MKNFEANLILAKQKEVIYGFLDEKILKDWNVLGEDETLNDAFDRVAKSILLFDENYTGGDSKKFETDILEHLTSKRMIPNTTIIMNAGRFRDVPLSACAVPLVGLRDDLKNIKQQVDELHFQGMGTGFDLDEAENPIEMIKYLNQVGIEGQRNKKQLRPVGDMGTMSLNNPNIQEFINLKNNVDLDNEKWVFNLSVSLDDEQIQKIINNESIKLNNGKEIFVEEVLDDISESIWKSGDPGLLFIDRIRVDNTVPSAGESVSVAPCGEVGLAHGETC